MHQTNVLVNLSSWTKIKVNRCADFFGQYTYECTVEHSTFTR